MKYIVFAILFTLGFGTLQAQDVYTSSGRSVNSKRRPGEKEGFDPSKLIWGGWFSFGLATGYTNLGISPIIGYGLTDRFSAGVGIGYNYFRLKNAYSILDPATGTYEDRNFTSSTYTGNIWARYVVWNNIFLQVQPELNSVEVPYFDTIIGPSFSSVDVRKQRKLVTSMLVGGGVRQPISERVSFVALILYDVLKEQNSPYQGIDLRFGINVGF